MSDDDNEVWYAVEERELIEHQAEIERLRERVKALEGNESDLIMLQLENEELEESNDELQAQNERLQARLLVEAEAKGRHALAAYELRDALIRIAGFDHGRQVLSSVELARIARRALGDDYYAASE